MVGGTQNTSAENTTQGTRRTAWSSSSTAAKIGSRASPHTHANKLLVFASNIVIGDLVLLEQTNAPCTTERHPDVLPLCPRHAPCCSFSPHACAPPPTPSPPSPPSPPRPRPAPPPLFLLTSILCFLLPPSPHLTSTSTLPLDLTSPPNPTCYRPIHLRPPIRSCAKFSRSRSHNFRVVYAVRGLI